MELVENCLLGRKRLSLIVVSHGMFRDKFNLFDTAKSLADSDQFQSKKRLT